MIFILALISFYPRILFGFLITDLIWKTTQKEFLFIKTFLALAIGFGVSSLLSFLWIWIGFSLINYVRVEIFMAILVSLSFIKKYYKNISLKTAYLSFFKIKEKIWLYTFLASGFIFIVTLVLKGLENPHGGFDAWYNWNIVSRFIYRGEDEWQNTFLRIQAHPDYPFYIPMTNALSWAYLKKETIFAPIAFNLVLSLFTACLLFSFTNVFKGFKQAVLIFVFFVAQSYATSAMGQLADFPLSYLILSIGGLTLLYFKTGENRLAILVGFVTGLTLWVKNEGFVTMISSTLIWIYINWFHNKNTLRNYLLGLVFPLSIVIAFKVFLAPSNDIIIGWQATFESLLNPERYIYILQKFILEPLNISKGYIHPIAFIIIYILVIGKSPKKQVLMPVVFMSVFQLFAYFVVYLITPHNLEWHLKTSLSRLYLHVYPLFFLIIFTWLKSPDELIEKETN